VRSADSAELRREASHALCCGYEPVSEPDEQRLSPAPRARILGVGVSAVTMDRAIAHIRDWIETGTKNFAADVDEIASKPALDCKGGGTNRMRNRRATCYSFVKHNT
jgi:hypothetical protein